MQRWMGECDLIKDSFAGWTGRDDPALINRDQEGNVEHVPAIEFLLLLH